MTSWRWLESTHELQTETYGYDLADLATQALAHADPKGMDQERLERVTANRERLCRPLIDYLDWNVTAAVQELAEVREEFSWKPWATDPLFAERDRIRDEVIDVLHFLGNILVALGVADEELANHYQVKQDRNRARQASGTYSSVKGGIAAGSDV